LKLRIEVVGPEPEPVEDEVVQEDVLVEDDGGHAAEADVARDVWLRCCPEKFFGDVDVCCFR
jgi:hypothetical protein